jgi:hypothetical protein
MSLFGSREDDPLLQDDPLAPSSDEEGPEEAPTGEEPESAEPEGGADEPPPQDDPEEEWSLSPAVSRGSGDSVFAPTGSNGEEGDSGFFHFEGEDDERVIVRTAREAAAGRLNVLNSALNGGWRLGRIELREDDSSDDASIECVFVLRRPGGG